MIGIVLVLMSARNMIIDNSLIQIFVDLILISANAYFIRNIGLFRIKVLESLDRMKQYNLFMVPTIRIDDKEESFEMKWENFTPISPAATSVDLNFRGSSHLAFYRNKHKVNDNDIDE
jgi:hypothetical protein